MRWLRLYTIRELLKTDFKINWSCTNTILVTKVIIKRINICQNYISKTLHYFLLFLFFAKLLQPNKKYSFKLLFASFPLPNILRTPYLFNFILHFFPYAYNSLLSNFTLKTIKYFNLRYIKCLKLNSYSI